MAAAKIELVDSEDEEPSIDNDAKEFGRHSKQGGWRLGLLVARSCTKEQGKRTDLGTGAEEKVSCAEFARRAGVSERTVRYYFDAWELAAKEGLRQSSSKLSPGDDDLADMDEDDEETRFRWSYFYGLAKKPKEKKQDSKPIEKKQDSSNANSVAAETDSDSKVESKRDLAASEKVMDRGIRINWLTENLESIRVSTDKISHLTSEANSDKEIDLIKQIMAEADALYKAAKAQLSVLGLETEHTNPVDIQQDTEEKETEE